MTKGQRPTIALLRQLIRYDPETGVLFWRARLEKHFSGSGPGGKPASCRAWNKRFADQPVGTPDSAGHLRTLINGYVTSAHRLAWAISYGRWPHEIDHINGVPADNRLCNLREVSHEQNMRNRRLRVDSSTGINGVYAIKSGKYIARIHVRGKPLHLGTFPTMKLAAAARARANREHGYHPNHGISSATLRFGKP